MCLYVGSYTGQILEYDNEIEHLGSDVKCLASELGDRLCLEFVSSDGDADDDGDDDDVCLLYTSPSPRDGLLSRMPSSA